MGRPEAIARWPWLAGARWRELAQQFPVRIPRGWADRADRADRGGRAALLSQALPDDRELEAAADDRGDPVGDALRSPVPWVVRKHPDRVLLLLTKQCHLYCRYCFRRNHRPGESDSPSPAEWEGMLEYAATSGAKEVILSGGDPLALPDARLFEAIDRVRRGVPTVRIHTRAPITAPSRVTEALVAGLRARAPVWVLVHANHPDELTQEVVDGLCRLVDGGVPVLNQSVLLAGVNDDVDVLVRLSEALVRLRVYPYYLHHPDAAAGNAHFRVTMERGLELHRELRRRVSGIGLPSYVIDPEDGLGKVPVAEWWATGGVRASTSEATVLR